MNLGIGPTYLGHHSTLTRCENVGGMFLQCFRFHTPLIKLDSRVWHQVLRCRLATGIQGIQTIQVNWFHLDVRMVHLMCLDPTVHAGTMNERVSPIRVLNDFTRNMLT